MTPEQIKTLAFRLGTKTRHEQLMRDDPEYRAAWLKINEVWTALCDDGQFVTTKGE